MKLDLKQYLLECGATVVGFGKVQDALEEEIAHLKWAISIGVDRKLNEDTVAFLSSLEKKVARLLKGYGYRYLTIPPDSDRRDGTYISKLYDLFSHKVAATCSGIGWVGRNGLLINRDYGPGLSFTTVLTDAPLDVDEPINSCLCGECKLCVEHCPAGAISGKEWSRQRPFPQLVDHNKCREHKKNSKRTNRKPNCGLCINICPYGRKKPDSGTGTNNSSDTLNDMEEDRCLLTK